MQLDRRPSVIFSATRDLTLRCLVSGEARGRRKACWARDANGKDKEGDECDASFASESCPTTSRRSRNAFICDRARLKVARIPSPRISPIVHRKRRRRRSPSRRFLAKHKPLDEHAPYARRRRRGNQGEECLSAARQRRAPFSVPVHGAPHGDS